MEFGFIEESDLKRRISEGFEKSDNFKKIEGRPKTPFRERPKKSTPARVVYLCVKCDRPYKTKRGLIKHFKACDKTLE